MGYYIPQTKSISLFRDPIFPGGVTIPIVGPVKPSYKIAAFFPTSQSFGPIADLAEEWVSGMSNNFSLFTKFYIAVNRIRRLIGNSNLDADIIDLIIYVFVLVYARMDQSHINQNFELNKSRQKFHHSLKDYHFRA